MKYVLVVHDETLSERNTAPFATIGSAPVVRTLGGLIIFGPYDSQKAASDAGRTISYDEFSWAVVTLETLSERVDNPGGHLFMGDSPDD